MGPDRLKERANRLATEAVMSLCRELDNEPERRLGMAMMMSQVAHHLTASLQTEVIRSMFENVLPVQED